MSERYNQSPEHEKDFILLLEASKDFLKDTVADPGSNYEPIHIPLIWLIKEEDVVLGYRNVKLDPFRQESNLRRLKWNRLKMTDAEKRVDELVENGIYNVRIENATVGSWEGEIDFRTYQTAKLEHHRLKAIGNEVLFDFKAYRYDYNGYTKNLYERTIYSSTDGLLQFSPSGELGNALERGGHVDPSVPYKDEEDLIGRIISYFTCSDYLTDPILRTTYYLEGKTPDIRQ